MEKYLASAIEAAVNEAKTGLEEGGIPIGAVVLKGRKKSGEGITGVYKTATSPRTVKSIASGRRGRNCSSRRAQP